MDKKEGFEDHLWYLELKVGLDFRYFAILPDEMVQTRGPKRCAIQLRSFFNTAEHDLHDVFLEFGAYLNLLAGSVSPDLKGCSKWLL